MMERSELLEAMDACRPGSDDLRLPEMAPLADQLASDQVSSWTFSRIQRINRRIAATTREVPVPAGLAGRILASLQMTSENGPPVEVAPANVGDERPTPAPPDTSKRRRIGRRGWSIVAAAACLVAAFSIAFWPRPSELTRQQLLNDSSEWARQLWNGPTHWTALGAGERELPKYPLPVVLAASATYWADAGGMVDLNAVAYDLSSGGGPRAVLFVIREDEIDADATPPNSPQSSTGGLMIGCWQSQGLVYVLVVEGDERTYKSLLKPVPVRPFA
jgi:hypothetical protein